MSSEPINLIWLEGQDCAGCTISTSQASNPTLMDIISENIPGLEGLRLAYHPTLMFEWGEDAAGVLVDAMNGKYDPFVLILEGAIPDESRAANGVYCVVGEYKGTVLKLSHVIDELSKRCVAAVAVGTCACYGGIPHGKPNPTGAQGLLDYLGKQWKGALELPLICVPGCPPRPDNVVQVLGHAVLAARGIAPLPVIDNMHRLVSMYGATVHESCAVGGLYSGGVACSGFGEDGCRGLVGCKGLLTHCNAASMWVDGYGGCTRTGAPCYGCAHPNFPDPPTSPFFAEAPMMEYTKEIMRGMFGHMKFALEGFRKRVI